MNELIDNKLFLTNDLRTKNIKKLNNIIEKIIKKYTTKVLVNKLEKFGIPCAPVNKINESLKIKSLKERNHLLETKINKYIGSPIKLSGYKNTNKRKIPIIQMIAGIKNKNCFENGFCKTPPGWC